MALPGCCAFTDMTPGQRHFGPIEKKVIHRYFLLLYFKICCGIWVYTEKSLAQILKLRKMSTCGLFFSA